MRFRWLCLVLTAAIASTGPSADAAEPYLEFLSALRSRQYYDYALSYLDQIEADPNVPQEVRDVLLYEKAMTLLASSQVSRNAETQIKQLDEAEALLEQFMSAHKEHPLAAQAATERAQIHLGKARVAVNQSKSPSNEGNKAELQQQARSNVSKAREIFQTAHDKHKAIYDGFPKFISKDTDPDEYEKRADAEVNVIRAELDLALCTYEEAQTYDPSAPEFKKLLTDASLAFETIHTKYRSQVAGLFARMWQGKCFEEQEDLGKALGIYSELLRHPGTSDALRRLQEQVFQFQLICYNHELRKEYQLVIDKAEPWLNTNRRGARTPIGLGIRWELARSLEQKGLERTLAKPDRDKLLRRALEHAQTINAFQSQYKDVSTFMVQRLKGLLDLGSGDPKDFEGAIGLATHMVKEVGAMNSELEAARAARKPREEIAKIESDRTDHLKETARILKLALGLATDETDVTQINRARYLLAFIYYSGDQNYESAVLGEFVGRRYQSSDPQMALDSAYVAMAAWQKAYFAIPKGESRDFEMEKILEVCNLITTRWPESERANDARMNLGRVYSQKKQPAEAAKWYSQVPEAAATYTDAQVAAGQAYWTAYLESVGLPEGEKPKQEEFDAWQSAAEKHLKNGIDKMQAQVPKDGSPPDELIAAKVSLAQIQINKGLYAPTIVLLTGEPADPKGARDPHAVMESIKVEDESQRPKTGVKSRDFAALAYQLLLRCYVGTQQIDKALVTMTTLENIAGGAQGEGVMAIYVQLGRELEKEIARLRDEGNSKRLGEVLASFDQFLNELYKRKDQMSLNSLVWIGETYYGLGKGMEGDRQAASEYFQKAASTYEDIVKMGEDPEKAPPDRLTGIKLRLVNCKRRQGEYEAAAQLAADILKKAPKALDAQFEAAYVLQDWGASGQADSHQYYLAAIDGAKDGPLKDRVWGWAYTSNLLQQLVQAGRARGDQEDKMHEARFNSVTSRYQYAKAQSSTPRKQEELDKAKAELEAFVSISGEIDDGWWEKYDAVYQDIQKEAGQSPAIPLERPEVILASEPAPLTQATPDSDVKPETTTATPAANTASSSSTTYLVFGLILVGGLAAVGGGVFYSMNSQKKRRKSRYATAGASAAAPTAPTKRPAAAAKSRPSGANGSNAAKIAGNGGAASAGTDAAGVGGVKPAAARPKPTKPRPPAST